MRSTDAQIFGGETIQKDATDPSTMKNKLN